MKNKTIRVDPRFERELEDILKERKKRGIDKCRTSLREITSLIPRHKFWKRIKENIIEYRFKEKTNFESGKEREDFEDTNI